MPEVPQVTIPVAYPTFAIDGAELVQTPLTEVFPKVKFDPVQPLAGPVIGADIGLTVKVMLALQPDGVVKLMIVVPEVVGKTVPVAPILATTKFEEDQEPAIVEELNVVTKPMQTDDAPEMVGDAVTITLVVAKQPVLLSV
jgi:hypothetical protein